MLDKVNEILNKLYQSVDGMRISLADRERIQTSDSSFTYGEITPEGFSDMLELVTPTPGEVFYDLGAGAGKAVMCAAMLNDWKKCCGVELLPGLHEASKEVLNSFEQMPEVKKYFPNKSFGIEFINSDFLQADFSDADVIYMHATTFGPTLWEELGKKLAQLKAGTRLIVNTKKLDEAYFQQMNEATRQMSWGESTVYTYRKK